EKPGDGGGAPEDHPAGAPGAGEGDGGGEGGEGGRGEGDRLPGEPDDEIDYEQDGRKVDDKTKKAIAELAKTNKDAARAVRDAYFRPTALLKELPEAKTFDEAIKTVRGMKATIESLGGEEGITKLNEEVGDYRREIDQFAKGDPALIKQLYEAN